MIRNFTSDDIVSIEQIGKILNKDYKFKINPYMHCFVYEQGTSIVGFIIFSIMYEKAEIIDIAVDSEYQRQDIGSKLLFKAIDECMLYGCESITLEVRKSNLGAISFYKKHGFREIGTRKSYYYDGEDALLMIKMVI